MKLRVIIALAALVLGCQVAEPGDRVELSVFAASSLTESFYDVEREFERSNPEIDVRLTFAGSQVLRMQLDQGADADVFASANQDHVATLVEAGTVLSSQTFAQSELVVIVPVTNPASVESFEDLVVATRLVIGAQNVPVGIYTQELFERARTNLGDDFVAAVRRNVVSEESNVRLVRAKVELGEADAAIVYRTDAAPSAAVRLVPIPADMNVRASYSIGQVARSTHPQAARQFMDFVFSAQGRELLGNHGFGTETP